MLSVSRPESQLSMSIKAVFKQIAFVFNGNIKTMNLEPKIFCLVVTIIMYNVSIM